MSWAKLDDRYDDNRKVKRAWRLHPRAVALHVMAITYCARHGTDGVVDDDWVMERLPAKAERHRVLAVLVDCGLFEGGDGGGGYRVHDFLDYNPSQARAESTYAAKSAAGRKGAQEKWRRESINQRLRQEVARRLGASPGETLKTGCAYCGAPIFINWLEHSRVRFLDADGRSTPELDHVEAVSRGGPNTPDNLVPACLHCNRSKCDRAAPSSKPPSAALAVARAAPSSSRASNLAPSRPVPTQPTTPLAPQGEPPPVEPIADTAPLRPGNRLRDVQTWREQLAAWGTEHFPNAVPDAVNGAVSWLAPRVAGRPVNADDLRDLAASSETWAHSLGVNAKGAVKA